MALADNMGGTGAFMNLAEAKAPNKLQLNYLTAGKKVGNFEGSLFASDTRGDGFIQNSWYNTQTVNFLSTLQATQLLNQDKVTILDVRTDAEFKSGHLKQSKHIPLDQLSSRAGEIDKANPPARATGEAKLAAPKYKVEIIIVAAAD